MHFSFASVQRFAVVSSLLIGLATPPATAGGAFTQTSDMGSRRALHGATRLPDGSVLVVGGISDFGVFVPGAELYDPLTDTFSDTGAPNESRMRPTVVSLADGRVLVAGGLADDGATYLQSAEIYDPATREFTATGSMGARRYVTSAALLEDGRVLLAGGFNRDEGPLTSAEIYDPATGEFAPTGSLALPRSEPKAVVRLLDGRVLIAGGSNEEGPIDTAEIYDPATGTFSNTAGDLVHPIEDHALALLDDGRVLVVGGSDGGQTGFPIYYADAELFDPATGLFTSTGSLEFPREFTTASRLPDGASSLRAVFALQAGRASGSSPKPRSTIQQAARSRAAKTCRCRSTSPRPSCSKISACCCSAASISRTICRPRAPSTSRRPSTMAFSRTVSIRLE